MGGACSCETDESTLNLGIFSCTVKLFGCMKSKDDSAEEEKMNEIKRIEERLREYTDKRVKELKPEQ